MSDNKSSKPFWILAMLLASQILFVMTLLIPEFVEKNMMQELVYIESAYGKEEADYIVNSVVSKSNSLMYESGVVEQIRQVLLPKKYIEHGISDDEKFFDDGFWFQVDSTIHNIVLNVQYALLRIYSMIPWVGLSVVIFSASIVSGYLSREIKKHGFEYSSPLRHGLSKKLIYSMPIIITIYLFIPIAIPVYITPIFSIIIATSLNMVVSNTIKRV
ncbi:DUF4400 domain-containing protein [Vibrio aestuarianus subsp. cardii]|uniref:DUF4400 domain-containing protein n=1 Tax=Vibrio aestuarianus TaxID=28171 RepID=UPI00155920BE|nr:DUF4400 domain-containing protein [Vibrio aestuarianus]NGZ66610.1 DUF4400 domain-containing protein [Vibrio aestuarianus subsp. cardii]